ncbi:archaeal transcriptional regulator TrmB family protein [Orientia tsutsugamushi str. UT144]|uniref:Phospholipase D n=1 Tax=Orientia tsutsugamushi str. UT144 TaxID=1441384 RepID=A0A0F3RDE7_ORITS|nr:phospholipase D family protein [Orientia tsutsugamushi]KJW04298.1 archaeal transcriptional regulator TrmB family protein [Orientia tsutsugamushi str. UT144]
MKNINSSKKSKLIKVQTLAVILVNIAIGAVAGIKYSDLEPRHQTIISKDANLDICFTPSSSGCTTVITRAIASANSSIYIQAYGFTSASIADEIVKAKKRGVTVSVILDKSNLSSKHSKMKLLKQSDINVRIDTVPGIAHNKVMIIDDNTVITGSFNFTEAADKSNAENVVIIQNSDVAKTYLDNWQKRYLRSREA